jgi:hypothetical protein
MMERFSVDFFISGPPHDGSLDRPLHLASSWAFRSLLAAPDGALLHRVVPPSAVDVAIVAPAAHDSVTTG